MKFTILLSSFTLLLASAGSSVWAQQIFRCAGAGGAPPEYINNVKDAQTRNCTAMTGGNVTVVQGTAPAAAPAPRTAVRAAATTPSGGTRSDGGPEQRARDSDSRSILESELKKAESKLVEQQKDYNNGEPEKQGIESRNYQRYLDRVAELKDGIARNQSDIAGIKREISRLPSSN